MPASVMFLKCCCNIFHEMLYLYIPAMSTILHCNLQHYNIAAMYLKGSVLYGRYSLRSLVLEIRRDVEFTALAL